jgi:uncharacterized glyoxalase superfamily protein PhnB
MPVKPIPDGYHTITPYLMVFGVSKLLEFLKQALDAQVEYCLKNPDGSVMHATARIGDSMVMMGEAKGDWKPIPASLYVYVPDVDTVYQRAVAAGGKSIMEPADMFYGDRHGGVIDPSGNTWWIATHIEDVSEAEVARRHAEHCAKAKL